jgi:hypothetical protein
MEYWSIEVLEGWQSKLRVSNNPILQHSIIPILRGPETAQKSHFGLEHGFRAEQDF